MAGGLLVAVVAGALPALAVLPAGNSIRFGNDKLTVRLHGTPAADILAELAALTGAKIVGQAQEVKPVVAEFDAVPISEALHRLLGDQNFTLVYRKNGKLGTIRLHGGPLAPGAVRLPPPVVAAPAPSGPAGPASVVGLIENHPPLPISGRLSQTLGATSATFRQLFEVATRNDDSALRNEASRVMLNAFDNEPDLRTQIVTTLKSIDDATVGQFIRGAAGDRAEEFLIHAATQSRGSELRVKASTVLQQLRNQAPGG